MSKRLKMSSSREVRRTINRINNMLLNGEIDTKTANALIYGCNAALGAIRVDDQQAKLDELEKLIKEMGQNERRCTPGAISRLCASAGLTGNLRRAGLWRLWSCVLIIACQAVLWALWPKIRPWRICSIGLLMMSDTDQIAEKNLR